MNASFAADDWENLFNGKDLAGWTERNQSGSFRVEDRAIVGTAKEGLGTTFLCTNEEYADFELEFESKVFDAGLNTGVQIRSRNRAPRGKQKVGPVEGPQVEITAKNTEKGTYSGYIYGQGWGGWLTLKDERKRHTFIKGEAWNRFRVVAKGDQVTVWINDNKVTTTVIPAERHQTHPSGFVGLQLHGIHAGTGPFQTAWRNLRIRGTKTGNKGSSVLPKGEAVAPPSAPPIRLHHKGPEKPFKNLPEFKDHTLSYFAMAPEINCPVSVVSEPGGAVFAICDGNAGLGLLPDQGSIWRLVDEDLDGKADVATKYIANIDSPRGGHFVGDTLYLAHPPFISAFRDLDGDGICDERKVLARGFAHDLSWRRGNDHATNALRLGIDGWLYIAVGDFGANAVGSDGSTAKMMLGGVIRMRPDGSNLEIFTQGTRNIYDLAINHRLDIIALDNTNDGDGWDMRLHHLTPLAHMGYPTLYKNFSDDAMPPLFVYGGGSGCGALYLDEPGFPNWFNRRFQTINWGRVYTHDLLPHEATFTNKDHVTLSINKIVDLDVDGSSRLTFASFEGGGARVQPGAIVGHLVQAKPHGWKYKAFPKLQTAKPEQLIRFLDQDSGVLRQNAQWFLIKSSASDVSEILEQAAKNASLSLEARIAALYAINLRNEPNCVNTLKGLLRDPALIEYALRALLDRNDCNDLGLAPILNLVLDHDNPRVRLQAVVGVEKLGLNEFTNKLLALSKDQPRLPLENGIAHSHNATPHTAARALIQLAPVNQLHLALANPALRKPALAALRQIHTTENVAKLIAILDRSKQSEETLDLIATLLRLYHRENEWDTNSWWGTRPNSSGPYYQGVKWENSASIATAIRSAVEGMEETAQKAVLYQVRRHNLPLEELQLPIQVDPLEQLLEQTEHTFEQQADLLSIATDTARTPAMRINAFRAALGVTGLTYGEWCLANIKALEAIEKEKELCATLSRDFIQSSSHRITILGQVPRAYTKIKKEKPPQQRLFFDVICHLVQSPLTNEQDRNTLVAGMARNPINPAFLESIRDNRATAFIPMLKRSVKDSERAEEIRKVIDALSVNDGQLVSTLPIEAVIKTVLTMSGDATEGQKLFTRQSCTACHSVLPTEPQKGPYLGTIGSQFNREQLITHVINPGAEVAQGFQGFWFKLKDGSTASGFITARDDKTITLRNIVGMSQNVSTNQVVEEGTHEASMMPPGLVNTLTLSEFASLIDYLESLH